MLFYWSICVLLKRSGSWCRWRFLMVRFIVIRVLCVLYVSMWKIIFFFERNCWIGWMKCWFIKVWCWKIRSGLFLLMLINWWKIWENCWIWLFFICSILIILRRCILEIFWFWMVGCIILLVEVWECWLCLCEWLVIMWYNCRVNVLCILW